MRPVWKGIISFGLVSIPIRLYKAVEQQAVGFRLLCKKCRTPIRYKRYCDHCRKEVPWNSVVKGIELEKDNFALLSKEEIDKLRPEKSDSIDIIAIMDAYHIEPIFYDHHYYMSPEKKKEKAFYLFREILQSTAKIALGRFVLREKEYTCMIGSYRKGMLLTTLNYTYEIRRMDEIPELGEEPNLTKEEMRLARQLTDKLYTKEYDMGKLKDSFSEKLKARLKKLRKGEKLTVKKGRKLKVKNLVEALKASIE